MTPERSSLHKASVWTQSSLLQPHTSTTNHSCVYSNRSYAYCGLPHSVNEHHVFMTRLIMGQENKYLYNGGPQQLDVKNGLKSPSLPWGRGEGADSHTKLFLHVWDLTECRKGKLNLGGGKSPCSCDPLNKITEKDRVHALVMDDSPHALDWWRLEDLMPISCVHTETSVWNKERKEIVTHEKVNSSYRE